MLTVPFSRAQGSVLSEIGAAQTVAAKPRAVMKMVDFMVVENLVDWAFEERNRNGEKVRLYRH